MEFLKYGPIKAIIALFAAIILLPQAFTQAQEQTDINIANQDEYLQYLQNEYYTDSYVPCDESKIADFDIQQAIADGVKYNEVAFIGSHNSYQLTSTEGYRKLFGALDIASFGLIKADSASYNMDTLTQQFEVGIRNLEIDVEVTETDGKVGFVVCHNPLLDNASSCYDFEKAVEEIKLWSDNNPGHLPISIIIEPKEDVPLFGDFKTFTFDYIDEFETVLTEKLGDKILTPAEMMGEYDSLKQMRENDGWLPLKDTLGKVIILLHDSNVTDKYIKQDESIKSQAMFPMLRYKSRNKSYTSFIIDNEVASASVHKSESIDKCKLIVRTRADSYLSYSEEKYEKVDSCVSQIISTDYPVRFAVNEEHAYTFDGFTVKLVK